MNSPPNVNPDGRPLPPGWISDYDSNYNAWFYVDTNAQTPVSTWVHPLGPPNFPPPPSTENMNFPGTGYNPRADNNYTQSPASYPIASSAPSQPESAPYNPYYQQQTPQAQDDRGLFSSHSNNPGNQQNGPGKGMMGSMGGLAVGGIAGLAGGALLGEVLGRHHEHERRHHEHHEGLGGMLGGGMLGGGMLGGGMLDRFGGFGPPAGPPPRHHHGHHHEGLFGL